MYLKRYFSAPGEHSAVDFLAISKDIPKNDKRDDLKTLQRFVLNNHCLQQCINGLSRTQLYTGDKKFKSTPKNLQVQTKGSHALNCTAASSRRNMTS